MTIDNSTRSNTRVPSAYETFCRPGWASQFRALNLDAEYVKAEKDTMWLRTASGEARPVLDFAGGFGAGLFGHNHPALVAEAHRLLSAGVPMHAQGSIRRSAGELAAALSERVGGDFVCLFSNSGTEVVESALKHAYTETGGSVFRAVTGAFHGKTTGATALSAHGSARYASLGLRVAISDADSPLYRAPGADQLGAIFFEPIRGEGGVVPLSEDQARALAAEAAAHQVPLIADEIQTGMGRTGTFLACEQLHVRPDYVCLSKALGGGLAKIGALLVARERYQPEFSITHTSTFAEDEWGCSIALRALRLADEEDVPARCAETGKALLRLLGEVQSRFPGEIHEIRGKGLMIGVELTDKADSPSPIIASLAQNDLLGWFAAAYFLNVHDVRVLPTLSAPQTLRIEPSAFVTTAEIERFIEALSMFCLALHRLDLRHLMGLMGTVQTPPSYRMPVKASIHRERPSTDVSQVAFVGHLLKANDVRLAEPDLADLPSEDLERFFEAGAELLGPLMLDQRSISSSCRTTHLTFIGLPVTAAHIAMRRADQASLDGLRALINRASKLAEEQGCAVLGLGGYTSALMDNGSRLRSSSLAVTSGNSLTVAMSIAALEAAVVEKDMDLSSLTVGVFGALGSIGKVCSLLMAAKARALVLIVRDIRSPRVRQILNEICAVADGLPVRVSSDLVDLRQCQAVIGTTAAGAALVGPEHLGPETKVLCDIAKPGDFSHLIAVDRPDIRMVDAGIVRLPLGQSFCISGIPLPPGHVFACMAETLLLGLEPGLREIGARLDPGTVRSVATAADQHGFVFA
jgi:acetylornithine/succinyldiaminopimelate/putrescine aminotransferase/predicted amino acid dehydrogenase